MLATQDRSTSKKILKWMKTRNMSEDWYMYDTALAQLAKLPNGTVYIDMSSHEIVVTRDGTEIMREHTDTMCDALSCAKSMIGGLDCIDWVSVYIDTANPYAVLELFEK